MVTQIMRDGLLVATAVHSLLDTRGDHMLRVIIVHSVPQTITCNNQSMTLAGTTCANSWHTTDATTFEIMVTKRARNTQLSTYTPLPHNAPLIGNALSLCW